MDKPIDFEPPMLTAPFGLDPAFAFGYEVDFWANEDPLVLEPNKSLIDFIWNEPPLIEALAVKFSKEVFEIVDWTLGVFICWIEPTYIRDVSDIVKSVSCFSNSIVAAFNFQIIQKILKYKRNLKITKNKYLVTAFWTSWIYSF